MSSGTTNPFADNKVVLVKIVQTCSACPSQWDSWDSEGNYWYLRYRHSILTAEMQPSNDPRSWDNIKTPEVILDLDRGQHDGYIDIMEFCLIAGFTMFI